MTGTVVEQEVLVIDCAPNSTPLRGQYGQTMIVVTGSRFRDKTPHREDLECEHVPKLDTYHFRRRNHEKKLMLTSSVCFPPIPNSAGLTDLTRRSAVHRGSDIRVALIYLVSPLEIRLRSKVSSLEFV